MNHIHPSQDVCVCVTRFVFALHFWCALYDLHTLMLKYEDNFCLKAIEAF